MVQIQVTLVSNVRHCWIIDSTALATTLTISEGGYITGTENHLDLNWLELLLSPYSWSVVFLAIISVLYISSGFLTFYASKAKDKPAYNLLRCGS